MDSALAKRGDFSKFPWTPLTGRSAAFFFKQRLHAATRIRCLYRKSTSEEKIFSQINIFFKYAIYNFLKKNIFLQTNHFHMAYIKNIKIYLYTYKHYNFQCYTMTLRCDPFILFYNASSPAGCATPAGPKGAIQPIAEGSHGGGCSRTCRLLFF